MDCCDREAMSWAATLRVWSGIAGFCGLLCLALVPRVVALSQRFGDSQEFRKIIEGYLPEFFCENLIRLHDRIRIAFHI
ncbi:hypothetical protein DF107_22505 [Burkholderia stagnalis]|nr:hypothetical protein DF107_22505 [Burkholderia stagnalis]